MSKKILVAGAGHGGLVAAALLSKKGYDVTVLERGEKGSIGYDWSDAFDISVLEEIGLPLPPKSAYGQGEAMTFINPQKTVALTPIPSAEVTLVRMERRALCKHLISYAQKCGAKFIYGANIIAPNILGERIVGVIAEIEGKEITYSADLVIDAAGCQSPVRSNLPHNIGIENDFKTGQLFFAYRALYERKSKITPAKPFNVYLNHMCCTGLDCLVTEDDYVDVLIARFKPASNKEIACMLSDFKVDNPQLGKNIIRGGVQTLIPLRRTIAVMVANGYAAVGDSAGMTVPLIGAGINNALRAGKFLADTVMNDKKEEYTAASLWDYQRKYFIEIGSDMAFVDKLKEFFIDSSSKDIDFLLEKGIITEDELSNIDGFRGLNITKGEAIIRGACGMMRTPLVYRLGKSLKKGKKLQKISKSIPEVYDRKKIKKWANKYLKA